MTSIHGRSLLTVNTGSSSLKAALYGVNVDLVLNVMAEAERIGRPNNRLRILDGAGTPLVDQEGGCNSQEEALTALLDVLHDRRTDAHLAGVGHRIVHGGMAYREPVRISDRVVTDLRDLIPIDPEHLPQAINAVETVDRRYPDVPQVACFDTGFHREMPAVAQIYALPRTLQRDGVVRYGFHGLSYEYIMYELRNLDPEAARGLIVIAHLGNGASMAAVQHGRGIDTTMGFTPTGGLVMGTRSGDLDPGVLLHLVQSQGMDPAQVTALVNRQSGMLGVSGTSGDMQDLLQREARDPEAALAVDLFCYQAKKFLAALAAALGGLNTVVFTGGIGEHAAPVRARICAGLEFLGVQIDRRRNDESAPIISKDSSPVQVRVMKTDEDLMIARHTLRLVQNGEGHVPI